MAESFHRYDVKMWTAVDRGCSCDAYFDSEILLSLLTSSFRLSLGTETISCREEKCRMNG